jgi:hypothetical protein
MKKHGLLDSHVDLFIYNFSKYYKLSLKFTPNSVHGDVQDLAKRFLKDNAAYLDSVDPRIRKQLSALLPSYTFKKRLKTTIKSSVGRPLKRILPSVSIVYRRQDQIVRKLDELHKKLDQLERLQERTIISTRSELEAIKKALPKK